MKSSLKGNSQVVKSTDSYGLTPHKFHVPTYNFKVWISVNKSSLFLSSTLRYVLISLEIVDLACLPNIISILF